MRFSQRASAYAANRPGYPPAAIDALLHGLSEERELDVVDVGAGTGISANLLAARVRNVIAVEPDAAMRDRAELLDNVRWQAGSAEALPLADKSVDVAASFQAFHWFDPQRAFAEFERVARRRVALVQYERDESQSFSAAYAALVRRYALDDTEALRMRTLEKFARLAGSRLRRTVVTFDHALNEEGLVGLIDSSSYLPREGDAADALRRDARALFARHERDGRIGMARLAYVLSADLG